MRQPGVYAPHARSSSCTSPAVRLRWARRSHAGLGVGPLAGSSRLRPRTPRGSPWRRCRALSSPHRSAQLRARPAVGLGRAARCRSRPDRRLRREGTGDFCRGDSRAVCQEMRSVKPERESERGLISVAPLLGGVVTVVLRLRGDLDVYLHCFATDGVFEECGDQVSFRAALPPTPKHESCPRRRTPVRRHDSPAGRLGCWGAREPATTCRGLCSASCRRPCVRRRGRGRQWTVMASGACRPRDTLPSERPCAVRVFRRRA